MRFPIGPTLAISCMLFASGCTRTHTSDKVQDEKKAMIMPPVRITYEESCRKLQKLGVLAANEFPPLPVAMPNYDDEVLGVSFFRRLVGDDSLDNLTLPRTYFGRSEIRGTSFKNSDLSESRLCWNDFIDVDFTEANLSNSDLRASIYERVRFTRANLENADLRRATFQECDFTDANLHGARLSKDAAVLESLTSVQRRELDYQPEGEEPPGG
jgi:BTB/POZ domain-containing protein KCTD9